MTYLTSAKRPHIPVRSEAAVLEEARLHRGGDTEKVATSTIDTIDWRGVLITSRYGKVSELKAMVGMVQAVGRSVDLVESIFCDSKASFCYSIQLNPCSQDEAEMVGNVMEAATSGHNGIYVNAPGIEISLAPNWGEEGDD